MFKDLINFLLLDFKRSFFILLGSILSGILQTSAIFTLFPLMYILDYYQPDDNNYATLTQDESEAAEFMVYGNLSAEQLSYIMNKGHQQRFNCPISGTLTWPGCN